MRFATFDNETTGLPIHFRGELDQQPRIIEFAGIITDGHEIIDRLDFIIDPGIAIEEIITKITGLTNADLAGKPKFSHYLPDLKKFFAQADAAVAHNLSFDEGMLRYDLERLGLDLSSICFPELRICTVEQTFPEFGRRMKLIELYEFYVGPYEQKHRAMDDVMVLDAVCQKTGVYQAFEEFAK